MVSRGNAKSNQTAKDTPGPKAGRARTLDSSKQLARLRRICKSIPGTIEKVSHGRADLFNPEASVRHLRE